MSPTHEVAEKHDWRGSSGGKASSFDPLRLAEGSGSPEGRREGFKEGCLPGEDDALLELELKPVGERTEPGVVDHYENPRNVGSLDKSAKNVGTGLVGAPACGDVMKLQVEVDENGKIIDARFKTFGCGSAIASSSLATEWVKGKTVDEALKIRNTDIAKELCLPPVKLHCSMLAEDAIKAALADYKLKQGPKSSEAEKNSPSA
ncbi:iron-sulfur cluster assembly enzyme ISCU, mitochondrial [Varanus komodoensis]|nr:iron-sulfur cluster assembly enzyme ISCU, mitochondrial [Varanus komodoensis]